MANMSLGGLTFNLNPMDMDVIGPDKFCSRVLTYSGVAYFSWGTTIIGKELVLGWAYMPADQYDDIAGLYEADSPVIFNPQDGSGDSFNVEITNLTGKYFMYVEESSIIFRKDVQVTLLVLSAIPYASASASPSISPSASPSISPSVSLSPSVSPSVSPSISPSVSRSPSVSPSVSPSRSPSISPSISPSVSPSASPSASPSGG